MPYPRRQSRQIASEPRPALRVRLPRRNPTIGHSSNPRLRPALWPWPPALSPSPAIPDPRRLTRPPERPLCSLRSSDLLGRTSRYSRYDPDRRSRSPRDRSPDRFDRGPPYEPDRRRSSAESRANSGGFPPNRDSFGDSSRRDPPRGPKALIDPPNGPRGGFGGDFRGRGRGRGRPWPARDDSRERGRERDIDYRDRYRDERSRERDRDRDRDRDWRDGRDFRARRSPIGRPRSPGRDFRDRDRDGPPPPVDIERPRRGSRDGPPSAGSSTSDAPFNGPPPFSRGGSFMRGRGRGGRGDWGPDRSRGRTPYDDRGDRYPRSRSQEGRWGRDREDRDRGDRYPDDTRRDVRDDRDRGDRELFRGKQEARTPAPTDSAPQSREVSPPPVAPSAPAFGTVPNRGSLSSDAPVKPSLFKSHSERPTSSGNADGSFFKSSGPDSPTIPAGPRAQQSSSARQWGQPNSRRGPDSPQAARSQSFAQGNDYHNDQRRPRSSGANSDAATGTDNRSRANYSAEPGEITFKSESETHDSRHSMDRSATDIAPTADKQEKPSKPEFETKGALVTEKRRRKHPAVGVVRFSLPDKSAPKDNGSESDDDEDMADYFNMEIDKTGAELDKLQKPDLPSETLSRYAALSHGSMVRVLDDAECLTDMLGELPEGITFGATKVDESAAAAQGENGLRQDDEHSDAGAGSTKEDTASLAERPKSSSSDRGAKKEEFETEKPTAVLPSIPENDRIPQDGSKLALEAIGGTPNQLVDSTAATIETTESGSKVPSTPSQVEDDETESEDDAYIDVDTVRQYMATPPPESLPDFSGKSWDKDEEFLASMDTDPSLDEFVSAHLAKVHLDHRKEENQAQRVYVDNYIRYLDFTMSGDPAAVKSRDKFSVAVPIVEVAPPPTPEPKPEGRTSGRRFASERDLERVLQASMREDEERKERELRIQKEKYRSEKEAEIPDMYWNSDDRADVQYWDRSGYLSPERIVAAWHVLEPVNNFTEEEASLFEKRYLEHPKQWGKIAEVIPTRDFGTCIQYYYLMKKDLNLKEKLKRQPKRRKKGGRGKQRSSALVSELGNGDPETEDNQETGENGERRRPRRAAAPTWGFEQPPIDPDSSTPASTPGRRARGDPSDKVDGRRRGRKSAKEKEKEKEAKAQKAKELLAAGATAGATKGRPKSAPRIVPENQGPMPGDVHQAVPNFEQPIPTGIQPPFSVHQQPMSGLDRHKQGLVPPGIADVMAAPSLRPEPPAPPQPAMSTFNLSQPNQDRKAPTQASSYWSVSESNDFPHLLRAFGSDWTSIAAHMGSKTAVMVKNYFVRQKDQGKTELEAIVQEADAKRMRGEKRPDPPMPSTGGARPRRYDSVPPGPGRPLAPGMEPHNEPPQMKPEAGQAGRPYSAYSVPIAKAPGQAPGQQHGPPPHAQPHGQQHPQQHSQPGQPPMQMQGTPQPAPAQPMSPNARHRPPPGQPFGFSDRDRDIRAPLPQKTHSGADLRDQRGDPMIERQKAAEQAMRDHHARERERERERDLGHPSMRVKQEGDVQPRHYEPFGHRQQPSLGGRPDPLAMGRPPTTETGRPYGTGIPGRGLLGDPGPGQSPPMAPRPMSTLGSRPPSGEHYPPPQSSTPGPHGSLSRPPEPRKTSNIMSLLNDDPPPPPKRVNEVASGPSQTPPPQGLGRPPPAPGPSAALRREPEPPYGAYGRPPVSSASAMPSLKPTYSPSASQPPATGRTMAMEPGPGDRDYYRQHPYQPGQGSGTNSPQTTHRYAPPGQSPYQPQPGYPAGPYGGQPPSASSPPPQYAGQGVPRGREPPPPSSRDTAWPSGGWQGPPKTTQGPPPPQSWSPAPQSQPPHHMGMRDERGYGAQQPMQSRYGPPPSSRPPEQPAQAAPYNRYSSTPGQPRDPRELPGRSYTPVGYDARGPPPPPPGPAYGAPDPRDAGRDPRDPRDPRDIMGRGGLRPQEYDRHPDRYGR